MKKPEDTQKHEQRVSVASTDCSEVDVPTAEDHASKVSRFRKELEGLLNCHSMENGCNTPDFILAEYLTNCLRAFDAAVERREQWYGRSECPVADPPNKGIGK